MKQVSYCAYFWCTINYLGSIVSDRLGYSLVVNIPKITMPSEENHAEIPVLITKHVKEYVLGKLKSSNWIEKNAAGLKHFGSGEIRQMIADSEIDVDFGQDGLRYTLVADSINVPAKYPVRHTEYEHAHLMIQSEKDFWDECAWLWDQLDGGEIDTLIALVESGPLWPGDLPSKASYASLVEKGLAASNVVNGTSDKTRFATNKGAWVYTVHYGVTTIAEGAAKRKADLFLNRVMKLGEDE